MEKISREELMKKLDLTGKDLERIGGGVYDSLRCQEEAGRRKEECTREASRSSGGKEPLYTTLTEACDQAYELEYTVCQGIG